MSSVVDLHMHSYYSDGSLSPQALVERGASIGLRYMAITDHDEVKALPEAQATGRWVGVEIVSGIEISTRYCNVGLHVLGYCFDAEHPAMQALVSKQTTARFERARNIVEKFLGLGFELDFDAIRDDARGSLSQPLIVAALLNSETNRELLRAQDHDPSQETLYGKFLARGCPAFVAKSSPDSREAIDLIHSCGGVAVLAHPSIDLWPSRHDLLDDLIGAGLDGLEVYSSNHDAEKTAFYAKYARKRGLIATGGSDFHGDAVPEFDLGSGLKGNLHMGRGIIDKLYERHQQSVVSR